MALATALSADPIKSFWSNFERMEGYITVLHLFLYFIMVGAVVAVENFWNRFFQVSIGASVIMGAYALFQALHLFGFAPSSQSGIRADTSFGNAIYLAVYMLFNIFLTLLMLVRQRRSTGMQVYYGIALVLQFAGLYLTQTRGAFLGMVGGLIVAGLYIAWRARGHEWRALRKVSLWGIGALVVLMLLVFGLRGTSFVKNNATLNRMTTISLNDTTTRARLYYIWPMAFKGSVDSPKTAVFGWGQENFAYAFNKYYTPAMYSQEQWFDRAHNNFLDWLIAGGYPAFVLYISLFVLMVLAIWRSDLSVPEQAILIGLLAGYAFNDLTVFDDLMSSVYFFTLLALVHALMKRDLPGRIFLSKPLGDRGVAVAAPFVVVAGVLCIWMLNAPGIARGQNLLNAILTQTPVPDGQGHIVGAPKDPKTNLAQFQVALGKNVWPGTDLGQQEVTEQLLQYSSSEAQAQSGSLNPSIVQDTHNLAEQAGEAINAQRQHDARLELFMGAFYDAFGQYQNSIQWLQKALADSPKKQQIMFEEGVADINSGNTAGAVTLLKQAFEEEPSYADARILYASALYYNHDIQAGDQVLLSGPKEQGFGTLYVDDQRLMQVYINTKMYDRLIGIWKARVQKDPNTAQNYVGLASAYFAAGDKANTIAALRTAGEKDPTLKTQADSLIDQINSGKLKPGQ
jgi:tetratricopeptide (TPR) repeat protein